MSFIKIYEYLTVMSTQSKDFAIDLWRQTVRRTKETLSWKQFKEQKHDRPKPKVTVMPYDTVGIFLFWTTQKTTFSQIQSPSYASGTNKMVLDSLLFLSLSDFHTSPIFQQLK